MMTQETLAPSSFSSSWPLKGSKACFNPSAALTHLQQNN